MTKQTTRTDAEWKALLAEKGAEPLAFEVTRHAATERPFTGKYEDHWTPGQYACICCGAKLFESDTKFDAGCGWPSFWQAAIPGAIEERVDRSHGWVRTETLVRPMRRPPRPCVRRRPGAHRPALLHELGLVRLQA
jgi:peptide-methionine (R)-S-oxide reductase